MPKPQADGSIVHEEFTAVFERLPADEARTASQEGDMAFVGRVLVGWSEIRDEGGAEIGFSDEARALFLQNLPAVRAAATAYWQAMTGREYARKNSVSSAGASPAAGRDGRAEPSGRPSDGG